MLRARRLIVLGAAVALGVTVPDARSTIHWHRSRAVGVPFAGHLLHGVQLPARGPHFETWDPALRRRPNRSWRRWGTDRLVATVLHVVAAYGRAHPHAPPLLIGDVSRPHGGSFGARYGALGHVSHQNGLDVDIYYPRRDRKLRPPTSPRQIDLPLARDLLHRFLRAGATRIFVGPHTTLRGPRRIVMPLVHHDNHMHVRIGRVTRQTVRGRSVRGRRIRAIELGFRGTERVLVVGCIHGNECAARAVVRELERSAPPRFDLWVVPTLNPDGEAEGLRQNANGVDLNRNFPSQWTSIGTRGTAYYSGHAASSEPETRFAERLIRRLRPRVTIWFHQPQGVVRAWGGSVPVARRFARFAGVPFRVLPWPHGSAPNWQNHTLPRSASFVVELPGGPLERAAVHRYARAVLKLGQ